LQENDLWLYVVLSRGGAGGKGCCWEISWNHIQTE
jgi:hypothetical protein